MCVRAVVRANAQETEKRDEWVSQQHVCPRLSCKITAADEKGYGLALDPAALPPPATTNLNDYHPITPTPTITKCLEWLVLKPIQACPPTPHLVVAPVISLCLKQVCRWTITIKAFYYFHCSAPAWGVTEQQQQQLVWVSTDKSSLQSLREGRSILTSFWAIPILSLQCISTRSAFSLANFSTSLAALPAIRCHSGTLFRLSWSYGKKHNTLVTKVNCFLLKLLTLSVDVMCLLPWRFSSCHGCAFCPHLSPGPSQNCPDTPAGLLAKSTRNKVKLAET